MASGTWRSRAIVVGLLCAACGWARADGIFIPPRLVPLAIPSQRAIVVWRDGVETLVVESTAKTQSADLGWVLPLPAEPTSLDVMDAETLTSMASCQRPIILFGEPDFMWLELLATTVVGQSNECFPETLPLSFTSNDTRRSLCRT